MDLLQAINQEEEWDTINILQDIIMMNQEDTMTTQAITVHQDNTMHQTFTEEADLTSEMKIQEDLPDTKTENSIQDRWEVANSEVVLGQNVEAWEVEVVHLARDQWTRQTKRGQKYQSNEFWEDTEAEVTSVAEEMAWQEAMFTRREAEETSEEEATEVGTEEIEAVSAVTEVATEAEVEWEAETTKSRPGKEQSCTEDPSAEASTMTNDYSI